ncbi:excinuclease ABC subunit UvrA [Desulfobotulus sp.]|jgi:excinuclease ABC subunit A|uniref:excinuclease ABC subunit UvrA n=1 Tax=Desulfobotulus sp. TaxID=1940337 RepID=UPI002A364778|nr:excinuclease ABC subunit UvrA [Desulfobotulus sp.]MDY0162271.1 excinuclease ABC subunit UvrA [Desulfobotulus sp.]
METQQIRIRGARQHNLKNIDVNLPRNQLVVITGLSGSGKSTLAFDTLYAEGQRRYVESLSTYARQFLGRMDKPDVDTIEGLSPAIAIEQKTASHNPRSTVGTVTEIYDYLRLLYARVGLPHCPECHQPISAQSLDQIMERLSQIPDGSRILVLAPLVTQQKGTHEKLFARLKKEGFARVRINGEIHDLDELPTLAKTKKHTISVVIDRLVIREGLETRLADAIELGMQQGTGVVSVLITDTQEELLFSEKAACLTCGISFPELTPASFSFNAPQGACTSCDGLGSLTTFDAELIVPDPSLSLREGAVLPWAGRNSVAFSEFLEALTAHFETDIYTPFEKLPKACQDAILEGTGKVQLPFYYEKNGRKIAYKKSVEGVIPNLERRYLETDSPQMREEIQQYMTFKPCTACQGTRLNPLSRSVRVAGKTISEFTALCVDEALAFTRSMNLQGSKTQIATPILKEITDRLGFLANVGLGYLTLNRSATTLSGGESQRIRLATQVGSKLTGVLYVLDEPSIGLHQRDNLRLLATLMQMRDLGNTVLVVEHDEDTIRAADFVVDMGPGAGVHGGEVVFAGTPKAMMSCAASLTGQFLSGKRSIAVPSIRRSPRGFLRVVDASANNLKNITAEFPLGCLTCVTGVSGSGKSTLVLETLNKALARRFYRSRGVVGKHSHIEGLEAVDKVINIDQSPIGRTPRSNPGTYTGLFTHIRDLFAQTAEARARGYKPGRFSFNVKGGRCEACTGDGILKIEMHFLPDVYVACDVCQGQRYNKETLEVRYKGKTIAEVLDMTVNQALQFFENIPAIRNKLETLSDVGLGYVRIGQSATTLSGGEAQRIKLSRELSKRGTGKTVYILDEPTTGLHLEDVARLLSVLDRLVQTGNTVIIIEHNLDVIKYADHIIDIGPEGGDGGGEILATGTPEAVAEAENSHTGRFLRPLLGLPEEPV